MLNYANYVKLHLKHSECSVSVDSYYFQSIRVVLPNHMKSYVSCASFVPQFGRSSPLGLSPGVERGSVCSGVGRRLRERGSKDGMRGTDLEIHIHSSVGYMCS